MAATALGRLLHLAYDHWHLLENALARDASCEKTRRRLDDWRATGGFLPAGRTIRIRGRCLPRMGPGPFDRVYAEAVAEAGVSGMGGHLLPKLESFRAAYSALLGGVADIFERGDWQTGQLLHDSGFLGAFNDLKDVLPAIQSAMPTPGPIAPPAHNADNGVSIANSNGRDRLIRDAMAYVATVYTAIRTHPKDDSNIEPPELVPAVAAAITSWDGSAAVAEARTVIHGDGAGAALDAVVDALAEFQQTAWLADMWKLTGPAGRLQAALSRLQTFPMRSADNAPTPNGPSQVHRLAVHIETLTAELDGTNYDLSRSPQAARWLAVLASHPGQWFGPSRLAKCDPELYGARPDRLRKRLPEQLRTLIESQPGQGSRLMA